MIDQVIHRIKLRQTELQVALAVGMPVTWEAYQRMVGEHQGLQIGMDFTINPVSCRNTIWPNII